MDILTIVLAVIVITQYLKICRSKFKIAYYEQKLKNRNIDDGVANMPWYKLWL